MKTGVQTIWALAALLVMGCGSTRPATESDREALDLAVEASIARFQDKDAGLREWFEKAHGYAVFPSVGKGGLIVGGAYGRGKVFEQGKHVGYVSLHQATIGAQIGGQAYSEIIFFKDGDALDAFKEGTLEVAARVSAVAANRGASSDAEYNHGVAIFTMTKGGLMAEASVGGQKFSYVPR